MLIYFLFILETNCLNKVNIVYKTLCKSWFKHQIRKYQQTWISSLVVCSSTLLILCIEKCYWKHEAFFLKQRKKLLLTIFWIMGINNDICSYFDMQDIPSFERIIYGACFFMIFWGIILTNSILIHKIRSVRNRSRLHLLFTVLSIFDLAVGINAVPNILLKILNFEEVLTWTMPCRGFIFLLYFPTSISWFLITVIALDRCFLIFFRRNHEEVITNGRLCGILTSLILLGLAITLAVVLTNNIYVAQLAATMFQFSCVLLISYSYLLIACNYHYQNREVEGRFFHINGRRSPTRIIVYIVICQMICVLPLTVILIIFLINRNHEEKSTKNRWNYLALILAYCNSIFNSLIVICSSSFNERVNESRRVTPDGELQMVSMEQ